MLVGDYGSLVGRGVKGVERRLGEIAMSSAISRARRRGGRRTTGTGRRAQGRRQATGADDGVYRIGDRIEVDVEFESEGGKQQ